MATPWVILGRVLRVGFVEGDVVAEEELEAAQAEHAAAAAADGGALAILAAAAVDVADHADADAHDEHAAAVAAEVEEEDVEAVDDEEAEHVAAALEAEEEEDVMAVDDEEEEQEEDVIAVDDDEEELVEDLVAAVEEEEEEAQVEDVVAAVGEEEEEDVVDVGNDEEAQVVDDVAAVDDEEEAQGENVLDVDAQEEVQAENVVGVDAQAEHAAGAPEPDFSFAVVLPPRVTVVAAGPGGHPFGENLDKYPYIIAAEPRFLLAHFSHAPFRGTNFGDNPYPSQLVLLHHFQTADGLTTASSVIIPERAGHAPTLWNIGSLGLYADREQEGRYKIVELNVHKGSERARLISFRSGHHPGAEWNVQELEYPMAEENRDWVPHGAVTVDSTVWWFDLSWGILSCDVDEHEPDLLFHNIPDGRALAKATPDIHTKRSITVSRNKLRYVEIIVTCGGAAMVCMWTRRIGPDGWIWYVKYAMSFERIWDDDSYRETGLPRNVPVLAVVCPSNPALVYFALEQRLFGVNVPEHRVMHNQAYELVNIPDQPQQPPSGRYVVAWNLPPEVAQALGMDPFAGLNAGQLGAVGDEGQEALADDEAGLQEGEIEDGEQPVPVINSDEHPPEEIDFAEPQDAVVFEELQAAAIQTNEQEQQAEETDGNELLEDDEFSEAQMRRLDMTNLAVQMDPETLRRLKAEVKECLDGMDRPGPSKDPEDDAGGSAV